VTPRRIAVVTGTRADYGLLHPLLCLLRDDPAVELQLVVTGMHLSPEFGLTHRTIAEDGFPVAAKVEMLLSSDTSVGIAKAIGLGTIGFADALDRLRPDIVVVLGDRFEILAAAQAAMTARIPIAHIHGGEATEGLIDEAIRHAVTKMAHLHFAAAEPYRRRIVRMGEHPDRVFTVGAPGLDWLRVLDPPDLAALERDLGLRLPAPLLLVTYHPVTLADADPAEPLRALLSALDALPEASVVLTKGNADTRGRIINEMIDAFAADRPNAVAATSLGQQRYLGLLRAADVVVGNSSSGLLEAPSCGTPTVNIGERQRGRLRAPSVIDCQEEAGAIAEAIARALSPAMRDLADRRETPFGDGRASARMAEVLTTFPLSGILMKPFYEGAP